MLGFHQIKNVVARVVNTLENENLPFINYLLLFFFSIIIRDFLESYSQTYNYFNLTSENFISDFIHYSLCFSTIALLLILIFYLATHCSINKIARVVLPCFILLLIAPSVDLLLTKGKGSLIYYITPDAHINMLYTYLTMGGGFGGVTSGIQFELIIALIGCFTYFRIKNLSIVASFFYSVLCYTAIFLVALSPIFINAILSLCHFNYEYSAILMIHYFLILVFFLGILVFYIADKKLFIALIQDLRLLRILHYELMLLLGVSLALTRDMLSISSQLFYKDDLVINIFLCMISIFFAGIFSIITNNIADFNIDKISNKNRPLIKGIVDPKIYERIAYICLVLSLLYAAVVEGKAFFLISVTIASYYMYSMPPFRFKRVTVISKLAISLNSIALIILGFILTQKNVVSFPHELFWIFFIGYTIALNFIDLKDIEGDKAGNILTLPILLSETSAKIIIGFGFLLTYASFFFILRNVFFLFILMVFANLQFYFINKKNYQEIYILVTYIISIMFVIACLLCNKILLLNH